LKFYKVYRMWNLVKGWQLLTTVSKDRNELPMQILPTGFYSVSAVDLDNNESPKSSSVFYIKKKQ